MNNRDPFSIRGNTPAFNLLRPEAASLGQRAASVGPRIARLGKDIVEGPTPAAAAAVPSGEPNMASSYAINAPTHRHHEQWQGSGQSRYSSQPTATGAVSEKIGGMFGGDRRDSLPMYKDKPYAYPGGRKRPWYRQKKTISLVLVSLAGLSWWFGILSPLSYMSSEDGQTRPKSRGSWSFLGSKSNVDWDRRAERVKDAFQLSFNNYEKYAWGTCHAWLRTART